MTGLNILSGKAVFLTTILLSTGLLSACGSGGKETTRPDNPFQKYTECKEPRPEVCIQQYDPVCAVKDTGVRCVTTPCPSTENATYPNACMACADSKVSAYTPGECPDTGENKKASESN